MTIKQNLLTFFALSAMLLSCESNNEPMIMSQSIHKATSANLSDSIPYATIAELKSVVERNVVDYSFAMKLAN